MDNILSLTEQEQRQFFEETKSSSERRNRLEGVRAACRRAIQNSINPDFSELCGERLLTGTSWAIEEVARRSQPIHERTGVERNSSKGTPPSPTLMSLAFG
jgi:hypothetical protein